MNHDPIFLDTCEHADCCGRSHLYNFPDRNTLFYSWDIPRDEPLDGKAKKLLKEAVKDGLQEAFDGNCKGKKGNGHVVEVTLTDSQAETWEETLLSFGFDKVMRFRNHKSGNHVNVYLNDIGRYAVRRKIGKTGKS